MNFGATLLFNGVRREEPLGVSEESTIIRKKFNEFLKHDLEPISKQRSTPAFHFSMLKAKWEAETALLSSATEIALHPSYQQIIGMGNDAVPLILAELRRKPEHWFWALKAVTGEDPVLPELRGRIKEMTEACLQWGRRQGYNV